MNTVMQSALWREAALQVCLSDLKLEIYQNILCSPIEGVRPVQASFPCAIVSSRTLLQYGVMTPATYIPQAQANAVECRLASVKTVTELHSRVIQMLDEGVIRLSTYETITLNKVTMSILQSYI